MKRLFFTILALAFTLSLGSGFTAPVQASPAHPKMMSAPCRDKMGKFTKCPPGQMKPKTKPMAMRCRDKKGKFVKCKM